MTYYASALLFENKIVNWKVGSTKWRNWYDVRTDKIPKGVKHSDCYVESKTFHKSDDVSTNDIFNVLAPEFFRQWEIHDKLRGFGPY